MGGRPGGFLRSTGVTLALLCQEVFTEVMGRKRQQPQPDRRAKRRREAAQRRDQEFYVPYRPKDFDSERG